MPSQIHAGQRIATYALLNSFTARTCDVGARNAGPEPSGVRPWQKTSGVGRAWSPIWIRRSVHNQRTDSPFQLTSLTCGNVQKRSHTKGFTCSPMINISHQFSVNRVLSASWRNPHSSSGAGDGIPPVMINETGLVPTGSKPKRQGPTSGTRMPECRSHAPTDGSVVGPNEKRRYPPSTMSVDYRMSERLVSLWLRGMADLP